MKNNKTSLFLLYPSFPILTNLLVFIFSYFIYRVSVPQEDSIWYIYVAVVLILIIFSYFHSKLPKLNISISNIPLIKPFSLFILLCSLLEYFLMGVPILGQIVYADFGLPLLHHISVSSWLIIFSIDRFNSKLAKSFMVLFFILNPLLMLNRDLLLISIFMLIILFWAKNKIGMKSFFVLLILIILIFGGLGQLRSPGALNAIKLPFIFDVFEYSPIVVWLTLYITSSSFNFYNNIDSLTMTLYSQVINVFPEPYGWSSKLGSIVVFFLYYFMVLTSLYMSKILACSNLNHYWKLFYFYLIYQSYMSIFSTKVYTTNTLFVCLIFILITLISKFKIRILNEK